MASAVAVGEPEPGLLAIGARHPAEHVIERAVLHHHDDDVIEAAQLGSGDATSTVATDRSEHIRRAVDAAEREAGAERGGAGQESAPALELHPDGAVASRCDRRVLRNDTWHRYPPGVDASELASV